MNALSRECLSQISRREFLKLAGSTTLAALFLVFGRDPVYSQNGSGTNPSMGRVTEKSVVVYDRPSFEGKIVRYYWQDLVFPITGVTIGDNPDYNRFWYEINDEGFIHSGSVQPVIISLNTPDLEIGKKYLLSEVTVPFTEARWKPSVDSTVAYRFYYQTTHWITGIEKDETGNIWYKILDDASKFHYFVLAKHLHILRPNDYSPLSAGVDPKEKRIKVQLAEQVVIAYEGDEPVFVTRMSSGAKFSNGNYLTPKGMYLTNFKRPSRHMASGSPAAPNGFDLPGVPWCSFITESGISFHGTYWHNDFGRPRSHGCMNLPSDSAKWIYRWTLPTVPAEEQTFYQFSATQVEII